MSKEIKTIKLPTSCITSNNTSCLTNIEVAPLESSEKNTITSSLFYMLDSMDTIVTEATKYIEKKGGGCNCGFNDNLPQKKKF